MDDQIGIIFRSTSFNFVEVLEIEISLIDLRLELGLITFDEYARLLAYKVEKAVEISFRINDVDFGALGCLIWRKMRQLQDLQR